MRIISPAKSLLSTIFLLATLASSAVQATSLAVGELAYTSFNSDDQDDFSFVLLTDISGTTTVYFTDRGWNDMTNTWTNATEGTLTWTFTGNLTCGTEIQINTSLITASLGTLVETGSFSVSSTGDVISAYTGTGTANDGTEVTNFIWSVNMGAAGWTSSASSTTTSSIPPGLTDGVNCLDFAVATDNFQYKGTVLSSVSELRMELAKDDVVNVWTTGNLNDNYQAPGYAYSCTALPVRLISFAGSVFKNDVHLSWSTSNETANEKFEVEESTNGLDFARIGEVAGNGNTEELHHYQYKNRKPHGGIFYYRLKQLDFDGSFEYSRVITLKIGQLSENSAYFYPNPSNSRAVNLNLTSPKDEDISISVFDLSGKLVYRRATRVNAGDNNLSLNFPDIRAGIYVVKIDEGTQPIYRKLILE